MCYVTDVADPTETLAAPLHVRVPPTLLPALDRLAAELSAPGRTVTRSDVVRELLLDGIARRSRKASGRAA